MRKSANTVNIRQSRSAEAVKQIRAPPQEERQRMRYAVIILTDSTGLYSVCGMAAGRRRDNSGIDSTAGDVSGIQPGNADNE